MIEIQFNDSGSKTKHKSVVVRTTEVSCNESRSKCIDWNKNLMHITLFLAKRFR